MAKFNLDNNGYNIVEVEEYIDSLTLKYEKRLSEQKDQIFALRNENAMLGASLNEYKLKEEEVSKALVFAVEKSEQIEKGSKKIYDLEIRRLRLIYTRWKEILDLLDKEAYSSINDDKFSYLLKDFEADLELIIKQNEIFEARHVNDESIKENLKENSSNHIKNLLNRMEYLGVRENHISNNQAKCKNKKLSNNNKTEKSDNKKEQIKRENTRLLNINRRFSSISNKLALANGANILDDDIPADNAYYKNFAKEKGVDDKFDLDAVYVPKEDLAEIMKAFEEI